jgi:4-coumarate--CoA ligase
MTECMPITEYPDIEYTEFIPNNTGHVSRNTELKIVDLITGQSLGPNIDGEIWVRGPKIFSGYLNNIEVTKETIDSDGWLHTGDIGHYDQNERIFITERLKEIIKYRTIPVSPVEIEQFLLTHESVAEVAVVGVKHKIENQWPRAYVKLKDGKSVTEEELMRYVAGLKKSFNLKEIKLFFERLKELRFVSHFIINLFIYRNIGFSKTSSSWSCIC